jgi:hypothetical protein
LDVGYFLNRKILRAGRDAALLHLAAICYLGSEESAHGVLPSQAVHALVQLTKTRRSAHVIEQLVKCELWHPTGGGDFIVHDWDVTNGGKSEAAYARDRQRKRRAKQRANEGVEHP